MRKTRRTRRLCLVILLDIKNTFNSVSWDMIMNAVHKVKTPTHLEMIIGSYLSDRRIQINRLTLEVTAGVPQGSVLGPLL